MSKKTTKQSFYDRAAEEHGYVYEDQMDYRDLIVQLNRGYDHGQGRWSTFRNGTQVIIKCGGVKVLTLFNRPKHFVMEKQAVSLASDEYELAIVYHFLRKENWDNWFAKQLIKVTQSTLDMAWQSFEYYAELVTMGYKELDDKYLHQLAASVEYNTELIDRMWELVDLVTTDYTKQQFKHDIKKVDN